MDGFIPAKEMRRFPRYPADMRVKVNFKKNGVLQRATVKAIEIATHGISVHSPLPLPQDSSIEMEIVLPGTRAAIRVMAIVRNKSGTRYGVEFLSTSDSQRQEITQYGTDNSAAIVSQNPVAN